MDRRLQRIRRAYDLTVEQYRKGYNPLETIPEEIKNSPGYRSMMADADRLNSGAPDIKDYLDPRPGLRFLDGGCCANIANYRLHRWPSTYYGVDISPALINAMKDFVTGQHISIGGLHITDLSKLPFDDDFFDIAAVIGVLEYCTLEYITSALLELNRVLRPRSKVVLDIPNRDHPSVNDMARLEKHLRRPIILHSRSKFEQILARLFLAEDIDDSRVMIKYFVQAIKMK